MADEKKPNISVTHGARGSNRVHSERQLMRDSWGTRIGRLSAGINRGMQDIYLAGLGVFSIMGDEGTKLYRELVEEGKRWEKERRQEAKSARRRATETRDRATQAATETVDEQVVRRVREGVDTALERAGMLRKGELDDLGAQVDDLANKADRLVTQLTEREGVAAK